jgi:hypothetical protein
MWKITQVWLKIYSTQLAKRKKRNRRPQSTSVSSTYSKILLFPAVVNSSNNRYQIITCFALLNFETSPQWQIEMSREKTASSKRKSVSSEYGRHTFPVTLIVVANRNHRHKHSDFQIDSTTAIYTGSVTQILWWALDNQSFLRHFLKTDGGVTFYLEDTLTCYHRWASTGLKSLVQSHNPTKGQSVAIYGLLQFTWKIQTEAAKSE